MNQAKLSGMVLNDRKFIIDLYTDNFLCLSSQLLSKDQKQVFFSEKARDHSFLARNICDNRTMSVFLNNMEGKFDLILFIGALWIKTRIKNIKLW